MFGGVSVRFNGCDAGTVVVDERTYVRLCRANNRMALRYVKYR